MEVGKKSRCVAALCLRFEKYKTLSPQRLTETSLALDTNEGDILPWMTVNQGGRKSDHAVCLQKGRPVPAAQTGHAACLFEVSALE